MEPSTRRKREIYVISSSEDEESNVTKTNNRTPKKKLKSLNSDIKELQKEQIKTEQERTKMVSKAKLDTKPKKNMIRPNTNVRKHSIKPIKNPSFKLEPAWKEYEIIQQQHNLLPQTARNVVELFREGNTIPFIARYRKEAVGQLTADELRNVKCTYDHTIELRQKVVSVCNKIKDMGKMNPSLEVALMNAHSLETLEEIYAPYKPATGEASFKQNIHLALEKPANSLLIGEYVNIALFVGAVQGLEDAKLVQKHLISVAAKIISTTTVCLQYIQKMKKEARFTLRTKKINKRNTSKENTAEKCMKGSHNKNASNFADYFDRSFSTLHLKPHQIMAINRAEHLKFITVSLEFPDFSNHFYYEVRNHFNEKARRRLSDDFQQSLVECYNNIVTPNLKRIKRAELKKFAEKASLDIFSKNLKQMLLAAPVKHRAILGVDPGFAHGCKLGMISSMGELLDTNVVYPHGGNIKKRDIGEQVLRDLLLKHECSLIALGNGTACRETETWIADMIVRRVFNPLDVSYAIVNESGASIYSCSKEASREFQNMDPNLISAVSLARRIQDPLSELVKVEPKHLGIGMYQHDVSQKRLMEALDDIVSECVSFVGVDINSASQCLLRHVAGLSEKRAEDIIKYRQQNGNFLSRDELLKVRGIGPLTYKQCAGFLKISGGKNLLDTTIVHPESYHIADSILKSLKLCVDQVGTGEFIQVIRHHTMALLSSVSEFKTTKQNMEVVIDGLTKSLDYDLRNEANRQPLFRQGVTTIESLSIGMTLTGAVTNCTSFGSFVDIGVGVNGLLHSKQTRGVTLQIGDRIEVNICSLELERKRIGLELVQII